MPARLRRPLSDILRVRSDARRAFLRPQVEHVLAELHRQGVVCEVIGSFAREDALLDEASDLDVLVQSKGAFSEADIWGIVWTNLPDVDADLVFAEHLPARKVALMKEHARG